MNYADVWDSKWVFARKDHYCISGMLIAKGSRHLVISSLCDGDWSRVRLNAHYEEWLNAYNNGKVPEEHISPYTYPLEEDLTPEDLNSLRGAWGKNGFRGRPYHRLILTHALEKVRWADEEFKLRKRIRELEEAINNPPS